MEALYKNNIILLLDSGSNPLGSAKLLTPTSGQTLEIQVLDGKEDDVARHEVINLVEVAGGKVSLQCRLLRRRDDRFVLERIALLDSSFWRNLRVPVRFSSFIYPLRSAQWQGRRAISSIDLSCGGVAFYCAPVLQVGECCEIVIPVTVRPVILKCQVLRRNELSGERCLYAAKFIEMCDDEETVVREAVFRVQLKSRPHKDTVNENTKGEQV
ncbi:PilZ domain-containing protein [Oscillibacter valericigenes]|nr:PilZ domain-containing protein [Oscillibacter valericigenes]